MNHKREYPISHIAEAFPDMRDEEYAKFKKDIEENGSREPITVWKGEVIDGRHRLRACRELGIEPRYDFLPDDDDPWKFATSKNLMRRDLTKGQKAMVLVQVTERPERGRPTKEGGNSANLPNYASLNRREAGEEAGVSPRLISDAAALVDPGSTAVPELVKAATQGMVSVTDARKVMGEAPEVQRRGLELKTTNAVRTLKAGVERTRAGLTEQGELENDEATAPMTVGKRVTLYPLALPDLRKRLEPGSVDVIVAVPPDDARPRFYSDLAAFAAYALSGHGLLVVPVPVEKMPVAFGRLRHWDLRWVCQIDLLFPTPIDSLGEPHRTELRRIPMLVYGTLYSRLSGGEDVIAVPTSGGRHTGRRQSLGRCMELVLDRFIQSGYRVCSPMLDGDSGVALAALELVCKFIGADEDRSRLEHLRHELEEAESAGPTPEGDLEGHQMSFLQ